MVQDELYTQEWLEFYEKLFPEENYKLSFNILNNAIKRHNPHAKDVLEIACGTGRYTKYFVKSGYRAVGNDLSLDAIAVARKRVKGAHFEVKEMEHISEHEKYDVICCLFEPFRYNHTYEVCVDVLRKANRALKLGGLFLADFSIYPPAQKSDVPSIHNVVKLSGGRTAIKDEFIHTAGSFDMRKDVVQLYKRKLFKEPELMMQKEIKRAPLLRISRETMNTMLRMARFELVEEIRGFQRGSDGSPDQHSWLFVAVKY